jgi:dolichol-phosphate mannosyltransferase
VTLAPPPSNRNAPAPLPDVSIVIPVYNEEESLPALFERLQGIIADLAPHCEVIFVNDGCRDRSPAMLDEFVQRDGRMRAIHFSRNFGHQAAVTAGVNYATGHAVIVMDADLQDPPEVAQQLVAKWREGFQVVYAQRKKRLQESWVKRTLAFWFYRILQRLSDVKIPADTGDFCLMDRRVVDLLNALPERNRYIRGLRAWLGFRQTAVQFERSPRFAGEPKYTLAKSLRLAVDALVGFSKVPLRLATYLGLWVSAASFLLGIWFIYEKISGQAVTRGWASTITVILFLGGVQLLTIGIIGEYLSRIYDEVKQRPTYVVGSTSGFDPLGTGRALTRLPASDSVAAHSDIS